MAGKEYLWGKIRKYSTEGEGEKARMAGGGVGWNRGSLTYNVTVVSDTLHATCPEE